MPELSICLAVDPKEREIQEVAREAISRLRQKEKQRETKTAAPRSSSLSWLSLPKELRLDILSRTELVDDFFLAMPHHSHYHTSRRRGFEIKSGKLLRRGMQCCHNCTPTLSTCTCSPIHAAFSTSCTCVTVPIAVFSVSKDMSADATVIFLWRNRFILSGDFDINTFFVQHMWGHDITTTSCIRMLDLEISYQQLYEMGYPNSGTANDWAILVACIASLLHLPRLWLSIDTGDCREHLDLLNHNGQHDYSWLRTAYAALFAPLYEHMNGDRRPEKFHVFLCWWTEEEAKAEKAVMGEEYESVAEGKVVWQKRHPRYPHTPYEIWKNRP